MRYNGLYAFRWIDESGRPTFVRYQLTPEAGEAEIPRDEARKLGREFLTDELRERLGRSPVGVRLRVQLAGPRDRIDDATRPWPASRPWVEAGRLELTRLAGDQDQGCERRVFDPTRVIDGIECSDDPLLEARRAAYSVSIERRFNSPR